MVNIQWREQVIEIAQQDGVSIVDAIHHPDVAEVVHERVVRVIGRQCEGDDDSAYYGAADQVVSDMAYEVRARIVANRAVGR